MKRKFVEHTVQDLVHFIEVRDDLIAAMRPLVERIARGDSHEFYVSIFGDTRCIGCNATASTHIDFPHDDDCTVLAARTLVATWQTPAAPTPDGPTVVCLCGSTRFSQAFRDANLSETLAGRIVLSIGCDMRSDTEIFGDMSADELTAVKQQLDDLHKRKIDLADEILVVSDATGYYGDSTRSEIAYARAHGKRIRWLETPDGQEGGDA